MASARVLATSRFASLTGEKFVDLLAPGLYAWGLTVAWPASQRLTPFPARLLAGVALVALVASAVLARFWPVGARIAGIWLFVASSLGTWALLARSIDPTHLDPVHGLLGSVGWAAFAVVWAGEHRTAEAPDVPARALPKSDARRRSTLILAIVATAASVPMALAWWVESTERALLAQATSLAAGIALVSRAADLAAPTSRDAVPHPPAERPKRRLLGAAVPLVILASLAVVGALFALLR